MGKLIDGDELIELLLSTAITDKQREYSECVQYAVQKMPTVDAVPVRCKDCKYNPNPPECGNAACVLFYGMTDQMGFCHHGERRERE